MAGIRLKMDGMDKLGEQFKTRIKKFDEKRIHAIQAAAKRAADEIELEGRANIRSGGNFGSARWQEGLRAKLSFKGRADMVIRLTHAVSYWKVFEFGAKILGRPLLWIPLSFSLAGQLGVRARDFPGKLFRVTRIGKAPLLMNEQGPQYFGKESVTIPRKWRLRDIVRNTSRKLGRFYREAMKNNGRK